MRFIKLTTLAAALGAAVPAFAADATLGEIVVHAERDDFEARQASTTTKLVYGREELDRMNELTVGGYLRRF